MTVSLFGKSGSSSEEGATALERLAAALLVCSIFLLALAGRIAAPAMPSRFRKERRLKTPRPLECVSVEVN
jgi:hypothetical protein